MRLTQIEDFECTECKMLASAVAKIVLHLERINYRIFARR